MSAASRTGHDSGYQRLRLMQENRLVRSIGSCSCYCSCLTSMVSLSLFIIACIAAANGLDTQTVSYVAMGMGGAMLFGNLLKGNFEYRKITMTFSALVCISIVALGILGHSSVSMLNAQQIGWGIIGIQLAYWFIPGCCINVWQTLANQSKLNALARNTLANVSRPEPSPQTPPSSVFDPVIGELTGSKADASLPPQLPGASASRGAGLKSADGSDIRDEHGNLKLGQMLRVTANTAFFD